MLGIELQIETVTQPAVQSNGQDPMQTRWAINFVRDKYVEGAKAGFSEMAFADWQRVAYFTTPEEFHTTDDDPKVPRERPVTKTASSAERYLGSVLGGMTLQGAPDPHKEDWGVRFGFYGEEDEAKMRVISATLLPSLPDIRQIAANYNMASPIGNRCEGEDAVGFGERQSCPACWAKWIESECCDKFIDEIAHTGRQVTVTDQTSRESYKKTITPTVSELRTSQRLMTESLKRCILALQGVWVNIATELENKERRGIDAYQKKLRQDIHALKPNETGLRVAAPANQPASVVVNDPTAGMTTEEKAAYYTDLVEFDAFRAAKKAPPQDLGTVDASDMFTAGQPVLCEDVPGYINEVKPGGWFGVVLENGENKTVRKDKLQGRLN